MKQQIQFGGFRRHRRRLVASIRCHSRSVLVIDTPWFTEMRRGPLRGHATEFWVIAVKVVAESSETADLGWMSWVPSTHFGYRNIGDGPLRGHATESWSNRREGRGRETSNSGLRSEEFGPIEALWLSGHRRGPLRGHATEIWVIATQGSRPRAVKQQIQFGGVRRRRRRLVASIRCHSRSVLVNRHTLVHRNAAGRFGATLQSPGVAAKGAAERRQTADSGRMSSVPSKHFGYRTRRGPLRGHATRILGSSSTRRLWRKCGRWANKVRNCRGEPTFPGSFNIPDNLYPWFRGICQPAFNRGFGARSGAGSVLHSFHETTATTTDRHP